LKEDRKKSVICCFQEGQGSIDATAPTQLLENLRHSIGMLLSLRMLWPFIAVIRWLQSCYSSSGRNSKNWIKRNKRRKHSV